MNALHSTQRILVFCKAPIPGEVKTRLTPFLSPQAACEVHRHLTKRTVKEATATPDSHTTLYVGSQPDHAFFHTLLAEYPCALRVQSGDNLGERMGQALQESLRDAGTEKVVLIGSDCPVLTADHLSQAFAALDHASMVFYPTEDGGYGLIGVNKTAPEQWGRALENIDWGTEHVLKQTCERLIEHRLSYKLLPELWDLDTPAELERCLDLPDFADLQRALASLDSLSSRVTPCDNPPSRC